MKISIKEQMVNLVIEKMSQALCNYFRVSVTGIKNIPKRKGGIIIANHGSCTGFDGIVLYQQIVEQTGRNPRIMVHPSWFRTNALSALIKKFHLIEAKRKKALEVLEDGELLILFPEAEQGNFKPVEKSYRLQKFQKGFVHFATEVGCPVIPTCIVGAEEANINLGRTSILKDIIAVDLPLPLNIVPLPSKWHIHFMPKRKVGELKEGTRDEMMQKAELFKQLMQKELTKMVESRDFVYLPDKAENFLEDIQKHLLSIDYSKLLK